MKYRVWLTFKDDNRKVDMGVYDEKNSGDALKKATKRYSGQLRMMQCHQHQLETEIVSPGV